MSEFLDVRELMNWGETSVLGVQLVGYKNEPHTFFAEGEGFIMRPIFKSNNELVDYLIKIEIVEGETRLEKAFRKIDRADFVRRDNKDLAYADSPIPIGEGQTISQPQVHAWMLRLLNVSEGHKVLEIGMGSGYQTALLCELVGEEGQVVATEVRDGIYNFGSGNLKPFKFKNLKSVLTQPDEMGFPANGPYDRIIVGASAEEISSELFEQLAEGGIMIIPVKTALHAVIKVDGKMIDRELPGEYNFVPLISEGV